jgi:hypothetical protein
VLADKIVSASQVSDCAGEVMHRFSKPASTRAMSRVFSQKIAQRPSGSASLLLVGSRNGSTGMCL